MEIAPHINVDPKICSGSPVITGTRVHVSIVIGALASDMTEAEVMEEYVLTKEQIKAALAYAAKVIRHMEDATTRAHIQSLIEADQARTYSLETHAPPTKYRQAGSMKGLFTIADTFDAPLADLKDYM